MAATLRLDVHPSQPVLEEAARVLRGSGLLAIPTESFYGLAASAWDEVAVQRVCRVKGRPDGKPILLLIADRTQLDPFVANLTRAASCLIDRFWPGPLTVVMKASPDLSEAVTAGTGTVGVRQTAYLPLVNLLRHIGPVTGTSANRSGQTPVRTAAEVASALGSDIDLILDGGPTPGGMTSTVIDTVESVRIVREGAVRRVEIEQALAEAGLVLQG